MDATVPDECRSCLPAEVPRESLAGFFGSLFDTSDFPARWFCGTWTAELGWLHIASDLVIFLSCMALPCALIFFIRRRKDVPFYPFFWLFGAFLLTCGTTHLTEAVIFWHPMYRLAGLFKVLTAVASVVTTAYTIRVLPLALAIPSRVASSRSQLSLAEESVGVGTWDWDMDARMLTCNEATRRMFGFDTRGPDPEFEVLLKRVHPEDREELRTVLRAWMTSGGQHSVGFRVVHDDGVVRYLQACGRMETHGASGRSRLIGVCADVTQTQQALLAEQETREQFRRTFSQAPIGIAHVDPQGFWIRVNPRLCETVGYTEEELLGSTFAEITHPDDLEDDDQYVQQLLNGEADQYQMEKRYIHRDGGLIWVHLAVSLVRSDSGEPRYFISVVEDITLRKQWERDIQLARNEAIEADQAKSRFLANMSHEIRTPLNGILGFTELLLRRSQRFSEAERLAHLETIRSSGRHLLLLINDILDLSKITAGEMEFRYQRCSPRAVLGEVVSLLRIQAEEKGIALELHWSQNMPATIITDPGRFRQLLLNVIGNAVKFTEQGSVKVVAGLDPHTRRYLQIDVVDTGIGMSPEQLERIFDPFTQADSSNTRRYEGTGLGLAISRHLARQLGGAIVASSSAGHGSTFRISVDTGEMTDDMAPEHSSQTLVERSSTDRIDSFGEAVIAPEIVPVTSRRILLAEDGQANRRLIQLALEDEDCALVAVENGQQAVDRAVVEEFDLILMDMQMPVLDGYTATRRLRQQGISTPIIALTAHAMAHDRQKCLDAGCSDYLAKPVDLDVLLATVRATLGITSAHPAGVSASPAAESPPVAPAAIENREEPACTTPREHEDENAANGLLGCTQADIDLSVDQPVDRQPIQRLQPVSTTAEEIASLRQSFRISSTLPVDRPPVRELVEEFLKQLPLQMADIHDGISRNDCSRVIDLAHRIKGTGGTMGFNCLTQPAARLEQAARTGDAVSAGQAVEELESLCGRLGMPERVEEPASDTGNVPGDTFPGSGAGKTGTCRHQ